GWALVSRDCAVVSWGWALVSRGLVCWLAATTAASNADIASRITTPTASAAAATPEPSPGPDSRTRRLARQCGHQAHSGESSDSVVAVSHTLAVLCFPPPSAVRICPLSCRVTLRAPERTSQRCRSPTGSLPDCLDGSVTCCLPSWLCLPRASPLPGTSAP